jgi:steroid 5-alpha reductase family enzyme
MSSAPASALAALPGDEHQLLLTFLVTLALQLSCFAVAYSLHTDALTDLAGSANFVLLALLSFAVGSGGGVAFAPRAALVTALVCLARVELAAYLFYRVLRRGKDARFDAVRGSFVPFLVFWLVQVIWVWVVSLPMIIVNADAAAAAAQPAAALPPLFSDARDVVGVVLFAVGFATQVAADLAKDRFRADAANRERVCDAGVWRYSRHPNFFGEMLIWWGVFCLAAPQLQLGPTGGAAWAWGAAAASPLITMAILLFASGIPTAEGNHQLRFMRTPDARARYEAYRWRTSPLVPLPNALYAATPLPAKRWLLCEFKMYEVSDDAAGEKDALRAAGGPANPLERAGPGERLVERLG